MGFTKHENLTAELYTGALVLNPVLEYTTICTFGCYKKPPINSAFSCVCLYVCGRVCVCISVRESPTVSLQGE